MVVLEVHDYATFEVVRDANLVTHVVARGNRRRVVYFLLLLLFAITEVFRTFLHGM